MAYTGPGDFKTYKMWAGLRGYTAAYAAGHFPCFDLYVSNVFVGTINILSNGLVDVATAVSLIGGGIGKIGFLYDQSGNGNDFAQATDSLRPIFTPNAPGLGSGRPSMSFTLSGGEKLVSTAIIPSTSQPWTMTSFSIRTGGFTVLPQILQTHKNGGGNVELGYANAHATSLIVTPTDLTVTITDVWHSLVGVANGASSIVAVDGTSTTGTLPAGAPDGTDFLSINVNGNLIGAITQVGYAESGFSTSDIGALNTDDSQFWLGVPGPIASSGNQVGGPAVRRSMRVINY